MSSIYKSIKEAKQKGQKLLAVLIDPEKTSVGDVLWLSEKIKKAPVTHILVGGSTFSGHHLGDLVLQLKAHTQLPVLLFPGHFTQITGSADGILFLSLTSGRNPDYLIEHQIKAAAILQKTQLEIIPTSYILIESGVQTAVERVSETIPIDRNNSDLAAQIALAGQYLGHGLIYLEAGSGALHPVPTDMIQQVSQTVSIPVIVGGGIRSFQGIQNAHQAGADLVVIGTAFEENPHFFEAQS
jgi:putative glycerol-1-phosphate prenyltransferase